MKSSAVPMTVAFRAFSFSSGMQLFLSAGSTADLVVLVVRNFSLSRGATDTDVSFLCVLVVETVVECVDEVPKNGFLLLVLVIACVGWTAAVVVGAVVVAEGPRKNACAVVVLRVLLLAVLLLLLFLSVALVAAVTPGCLVASCPM